MKLIRNVNLYSPENQGIKDVLIAHDKIIKIDEKIDIDFQPMEIIDGTDKKMIPGYIDQHVHITGGGGEGGFKTRVPELQLSDCIKAGVTTVVGLLGTDATTRSVENLVAKTKALKEEGITAYCLTGAYEYPSPTLTGSVKKDIVFIEEVIGVKIAISDHRASNITQDELIRLVSDVRMGSLISNKPGLVHFHLGHSPGGLDPIFKILDKTDIPIKHFRPTHIRKVLEQAVEFANLGGYIDITAGTHAKGTAERIEYLLNKAPGNLVTLSSDANGSLPRWNDNNEMIGIRAAKMESCHEVVKSLILNGKVDITTALSILTSNVAKALEIYPKKGCLQVGSDADFVLLDEKLDIDTVFAQGEKMMMGKVLVKKGTFEE